MASWDSLPMELKLSIWEMHAKDVQKNRLIIKILRMETTQKTQNADEIAREAKVRRAATRALWGKRPLRHSDIVENTLVPAAAVNRSWQAFFESVVFRSLVLEGEEDVAVFSSLVQGDRIVRLGYIRHLRLHTVLPDYSMAQCMKPESKAEKAANDRLLSRALWPLLFTLGGWVAPQKDLDGRASWSPSRPGLTLELSAGSWSDTKYVATPYEMHRCYPFETADDLHRGRARGRRARDRHPYDRCANDLYKAIDGHHPFDDGLTVAQRKACTIRQVGVRPLRTSIRRAAPTLRRGLTQQHLDIVRSLVVRLRFRRAFDSRLLVRILELGCRSIHTLRVEMNNEHISVIDGIFVELAKKRRPLALRSLHVLSNCPIFLRSHRGGRRNSDALRATVAAAALQASRSLTHLTTIRYATADSFFSLSHARVVGGHRRWRLAAGRGSDDAFWPHLETISLEDHSHWGDNEQGVQTLIRAAAMVREMPRLRILELCNKGFGQRQQSEYGTRYCFFRFEAPSVNTDRHPSIVFGGDWDVPPLWTDACRDAWIAAAKTFAVDPDRSLRVQFHKLPFYRSANPGLYAKPHHGTIHDHPALHEKKIDPVTHSQLRNSGWTEYWMRLRRDVDQET